MRFTSFDIDELDRLRSGRERTRPHRAVSIANARMAISGICHCASTYDQPVTAAATRRYAHMDHTGRFPQECAMAERRYPPNRLLAWERLQLGWSYEALADRIRVEMVRCEEGDTGLTANTVRRWETGERWPDPRFRKHLVVILGRPASELGLLTAEELAVRPADNVLAEIKRLVSMAEDGPRARGMNRADFLHGLLGVGSLPLLTRLIGNDDYEHVGATTDHRSTSDAGTAAAYARIVAAQRELYWTSPARDLFESAYAHAQLGFRLLRATAADQARTTLSVALAESAMLAGRLA
ncbi:MAG: helix-turn-helix domain-containing protein, partial [Nocardioides sp.]